MWPLLNFLIQLIEIGLIAWILKIDRDALKTQKGYWKSYFQAKTEWYERRAKIKNAGSVEPGLLKGKIGTEAVLGINSGSVTAVKENGKKNGKNEILTS